MDTASNTEVVQHKLGIKLVFRIGDKGDFVSVYEGKIAIIDRTLKTNPVAGVSYTCELKPMFKGNGWIVMAFEKTPAIKANLIFKQGKKMYNEKTDTYKENIYPKI